MNRAVVVLAAVALGCPGKDPTTDSDSTATNETDTDTPTSTGETGDSADSGDTETAALVVTTASVTCDKADVATLYAETNGFSNGGVFYLQETGNPEPQYSEN